MHDGNAGIRHTRTAAVFAALGVLLVALAATNLCMGSVAVPLHDLGAILTRSDTSSTFYQVVWDIRLPRLVAAMLLGGALALSGLLLQTFFNNPIAGPFILGISHGAKLAVALLMVVVVGATGVMTSWMSILAATLGSLAVTGLVMLASRRITSSSMLIVVGVMIGYLCNAMTDFVITFASDASIVNLRNWSMGSFSGTSWSDVAGMSVVVLLCSACVFLLSKPLGAYLLGEQYAQSAGVNIRAFRAALILLSSVLSACVTAYAGPISFVGIAVPHLVRNALGTNRPLQVVPASFLGGAAFCLLCDLISRCAFAPTEMTVSTVTAALGAPVVIWVLLQSRRSPRVESKAVTTEGSGREAVAEECSRAVPQERALFEHEHLMRPPRDLTPLTDHASGGAPPTCGPTLRTTNLAVGYDANPLVSNVELEVSPGSVVTLIGPNGAGKSTILKTLAGELAPLGGTVLMGERDLAGMSARELAQERSVLLTERPRTNLLTCEDVVEAGRYPYTGSLGILQERDHEAVRDAMELVGVWDLRGRDFMHISDGQRQRVMLARAICQEPRILMLDEPTSYLDIRYQIELLEVLRYLVRSRNVGVIMTMHELSLAREASDWLACVKDGAIAAQGTPQEICQPQVINKLYDLKPGSYDAHTGTIALDALPNSKSAGTDANQRSAR